MEPMSILAGLECLLGPAGEAGNKRRFFTEAADPFSGGVPFFSNPNGLGSLDLAFADCVDAM